jgi:SAM-dependent methyltransferase
MDTLEPTGPNAEQIKYWNETGTKWAGFQTLIDGHIGFLGELTLDRAAFAAGERVVDVGCGCGTTTLAIARRVGPQGRVAGIDVSAVMLARAREAAQAAALTQVAFENADAQTHAFEPGAYDALYSRFGVMFFTGPEAAFANLRQALRPGGRLSFICWRPLPENPWMFVPMMAAAQHLALPPPPAPEAPGPFALADGDRVQRILTAAGFHDIALENVDAQLTVGGTADFDTALNFVLQMGPTGAALRAAEPDVLPRVVDAVRAALTPYSDAAGVHMPAAARIVTARNP